MMRIDPTLYTTIPSPEGRLEKEMAIYPILEQLGIPFERLDHEAVATIEDCGEIDRYLGITIYKNLFLCNSKKDHYYLLVMPGDKTFKSSPIAQQIGSTRLSFGTPEVLEDYLNLTPGSVSITGLLYDQEKRVQLLIDEAILETKYFGFHPCINTTSLKIKTSDLIEKLIPYLNHPITYVTI